jgi:hypothetical protein
LILKFIFFNLFVHNDVLFILVFSRQTRVDIIHILCVLRFFVSQYFLIVPNQKSGAINPKRWFWFAFWCMSMKHQGKCLPIKHKEYIFQLQLLATCVIYYTYVVYTEQQLENVKFIRLVSLRVENIFSKP